MTVSLRRVFGRGLAVLLFFSSGLFVAAASGAPISTPSDYLGFIGLLESVMEDADNIQNINLADLNRRRQSLIEETRGGIRETVASSRNLSTSALQTIRVFFARIRSGLQLTFRGFSELARLGFRAGLPDSFSGAKVETGVVVFPASLDNRADQKMIAQLKNTFSDEVVVVPGESTAYGVIKPVFRGGAGGGVRLGEDYLYLLVPVGSFP